MLGKERASLNIEAQRYFHDRQHELQNHEIG